MSGNIDFLPARYGEQNVRRRSRLWLLSVLGIFASVIAISFSAQLAFRKHVDNQLANIDFRTSSAKATQAMFDRLQLKLATANSTAGLYAYLESRWPRTQILLAVSRSLTDEITLSELTIAAESENNDGGREGSPRTRRRPSETVLPVGFPAQRDLEVLRQRTKGKCTIVRLAGRATNDVALHRYVSLLNNNPLFAKAELLSFESSADQTSRWSEFLLRVVVRGEEESLLPSQSAKIRSDSSTAVGELR